MEYFKNMLSDILLFSTHQHHMEEKKHRELDLETILLACIVGESNYSA